MARLTPFAIAALLAFTVAGCRGKHQQAILDESTPDLGPRFKTSVRMNDASAANQLTKGFFGLTANSWRWTARQFSVRLAVPLGAASHGASVFLSFNLPGVIVNTIGPVTLNASIGSTSLGSQTFRNPGNYTFTKDVAPSLLSTTPVTVDFSLDKAMPPKPPETRELGIIVTAAGLESK